MEMIRQQQQQKRTTSTMMAVLSTIGYNVYSHLCLWYCIVFYTISYTKLPLASNRILFQVEHAYTLRLGNNHHHHHYGYWDGWSVGGWWSIRTQNTMEMQHNLPIISLPDMSRAKQTNNKHRNGKQLDQIATTIVNTIVSYQ